MRIDKFPEVSLDDDIYDTMIALFHKVNELVDKVNELFYDQSDIREELNSVEGRVWRLEDQRMREETERTERTVTGKLNDWIEVVRGHVTGIIEFDNLGRFREGEMVTTSSVKEWIPDRNNPTAVRTRNSFYLLGERNRFDQNIPF